MEICISHLSKDYGRHRALDDVSFDIGDGMFGLLGPNGAGKTTLIRILTTLQPPTSGRVTVGGLDILREPDRVRERLGYLPQSFGFYTNLTAYEVLDYIAVMKNIPARERAGSVETVLQEVNLQDAARRRVGTFSGGMKQRLGIAQALMGDPHLLVVDEPTAGLDPEERIRFRNLLARLAPRRTVLLSTHIVADIEASCSGVVVLNRGKLAFLGTPDALAQVARGKVWQANLNSDELSRVEDQYHVMASRSLDDALQARLIGSRSPSGEAMPVEPTIEDGYIAVVKGLMPTEARHA